MEELTVEVPSPIPSQEGPIAVEESAVETATVSEQPEVKEGDILPQDIKAPEDVDFEKPESSTPVPLESFGSCGSTVIIDHPVWPASAQPAPKVPTYLLPTKSQQAKRRSDRIQEYAQPIQKPKVTPQRSNKDIPFSLATTMRVQDDIVPSRFQTKPAPVKRSAFPKPPTQPRSPALATKYRKRQARPTEDEPAQFKALPLNKKILQPHSCQGVPRVIAQPTTVGVAPKFSRLNRHKAEGENGPAIPQIEGVGPSTSHSTAGQPRATRVRSTKPTTVPKSPKFQTNVRLGRPATRLSKRPKLSE